MKAVVFEKPGKLLIKDVPKPEVKPGHVIVKVMACGVCGTDLHIYKGEFLGGFPLIPGHEFCGIVDEVGEKVEGISRGERVTIDNPFYCGECYYCQRNLEHYCENFKSLGVTHPGGFAQYVIVQSSQILKISNNLSFEEAAFAEPTACVVHAVDSLGMKAGEEVLLFGAGPAGLILLQVLRHAGAARVVVAAPTEKKLQLARKFGATTVQIDRQHLEKCTEEIKRLAPYGFDVVIDATGAPKVVEGLFQWTKFGAKVLFFGVCPSDARITINPYDIYRREIKVIGTFAQLYNFPQALNLLENKVIDVQSLISQRMTLEEFPKAMELMLTSHDRLKIIIKPNG